MSRRRRSAAYDALVRSPESRERAERLKRARGLRCERCRRFVEGGRG